MPVPITVPESFPSLGRETTDTFPRSVNHVTQRSKRVAWPGILRYRSSRGISRHGGALTNKITVIRVLPVFPRWQHSHRTRRLGDGNHSSAVCVDSSFVVSFTFGVARTYHRGSRFDFGNSPETIFGVEFRQALAATFQLHLFALGFVSLALATCSDSRVWNSPPTRITPEY